MESDCKPEKTLGKRPQFCALRQEEVIGGGESVCEGEENYYFYLQHSDSLLIPPYVLQNLSFLILGSLLVKGGAHLPL